MANRPRPLALLILDGWGIAKPGDSNAITAANTPNCTRILTEGPSSTLETSGEAVGLPAGQMGNSEVGHLNIGAGRTVFQDLLRISNEVADGSFNDNPVLRSAVQHAIDNNSTLHLMGLVSPGGVHSHTDHLYALLEMAESMGLKRVAVHAFLDGRDVPPRSAIDFLKSLETEYDRIGVGATATVMGRYWAMDRDNRWDRIERAYNALVHGTGLTASDPIASVEESYERDENDEFVAPTIISNSADALRSVGASPTVTSDDSVIFINFRPDRARQISAAFTSNEFDHFDRGNEPVIPNYFTMTQYDPTLDVAGIAYDPKTLNNVLSQVLSDNGLKHLHIAETEKYAHVTYFFNGGNEQPYPGEERILVPSPKVATYDLQPEMSAPEVCRSVVQKIREGEVDVIIVNFANPDMVGHTGVFDAAITAIETVDGCVGDVTEALLQVGGEALILADHGNAELMTDETSGKPLTAHSCNPVPVAYVTARTDISLRSGGTLADVAPTMLEILGIPAPSEMTGQTLLKKT